MQTIPIIISEKVLKKVFFEIISEINKFSSYSYEIVDKFSKSIESSTALIIDKNSLEKLSYQEINSLKLFVINDDSIDTSDYKNNQFLISRPFKILDLFSLVENNIDQVKKREQKKIKFNRHIFDPVTRTLYRNEKFIRLTEKECDIFTTLVESKNKYLSKKFLLKKVWKYGQEIDTHTLETHLYSLRKKIDKSLGTKNLVIYEEKKGYLIDQELL